MKTLTKKNRPERFIGTALAAALIIASPGPWATRAFAQVVTPVRIAPAAQGGSGAAAVGGLQTGAGLSAPLLSRRGAPSLGAALPGTSLLLPGSVQTAPQGIAPQASAADTAAARTRAAGARREVQLDRAIGAYLRAELYQQTKKEEKAQAKKAADEKKKTDAEALKEVSKAVEKTKSAGGRFSLLRRFFSGSKKSKGSVNPVQTNGNDSRKQFPLSAAKDLGTLESIASDHSQDQKDRIAAVKTIASQKSDAAKAALVRVSEANPEGGAADYEVHRASLKALADTYGDVRSLRPISRQHADQVLSSLEKDKPELYVSDYDDTLEEFRAVISPEIAAGMKAAADAGVEVTILTDRQMERRDERDFSIVDSLQGMTLEQRAAINVLSNRGTETVLFDRKGEAVLVDRKKIEWSEAEKAAIIQAVEATAKIYGRGEFNGNKEFWSGHSYSMLIPVGTPAEKVKEAAAYFSKQLSAQGVDIPVVGRTAKRPTDAPYLSVSRIDKSIGVVPLRKNIRKFESMRDLMRFGLPGKLAQAAFKFLGRVMPGRSVSAKKILAVGDQFFDTHVSDIGFTKGAPDGTIISVGGKADPRLADVLVWPSQGRTASLEILGALGRQAPSEMNKKAVFGMFAQRTVSIAAFILSSIAYPFLAVPVVGWGGYGILMSFGPLAAIATGPLNGLIADRLSARNGMALNTLIRAISSLALPVLAAMGYLNFGTLLIASFANGWLLSSIMTTENAYIKRLAGAKNVFMISNLAWMNYLIIQVVLGLLVGIGSIVDQWNPMVAFTINAAVNAFIVLPIIWFSMPTLSPAPKTLVKMTARLAKIESLLAKAPEEQKEKLLKEADEVRTAIKSRTAMLQDSVIKNMAAVGENNEEITALKAAKASGLREKLRIRSEIKSLEADNAIRKKAIQDAKDDLALKVLTFKEKLAKTAKFFTSNWFSAALFGGGVGLYFLWNTTLPMIGVLAFWITTTAGFKALWYGKGSEISPREAELDAKAAAAKKSGRKLGKAEKKELSSWKNRLPRALLLLSVIALMMYPLQYLALPKIAVLLVGQEAKALVMGQLLGSLFFGNLIANAAQAKLGRVKLPLLGRVAVERLIQAVVVGLGATWVYTGLFAGNVLAAAAAGLVVAGLITLTSKLTKRAWLKFVGLGFAGIWLPYLVWGAGMLPFIPVQSAMMLALLGIGMAFGPAYTTLMGYFFSNAHKDKSGAMGGVQGSFFNAAVSGGYGLLALASSLINPAFPALLAALGVFYLLAGVVFWNGPKLLPGLPKTLTHPKEK